MAKKLSRLLAFAAVAGAAAGAVYYYKSRENSARDFDDFDDFEDEDPEGDSELDEFLDEDEKTASKSEKKILDFIPLNLSSEAVDEAKETIKQAASEIGSTVVGTAHKVSSIVKPSTDASNDDVEEFSFSDFEADEDDFEDAVEDEMTADAKSDSAD